MPGAHPFNLALPISTTFGKRSTALGITAEPLLAERGDECSEEGDGQTREKDCLDMDNDGIGASPYGLVRGNAEVGCFLKSRIGNEHEDGVVQLGVIRLQLSLNGEDETGRDG